MHAARVCTCMHVLAVSHLMSSLHACMPILSLPALDFIVTEDSELLQAFPSGTSSGSLCISIQALNDSAIEDPEDLIVRVESNDTAALISVSDVFIMIFDVSNGKKLAVLQS